MTPAGVLDTSVFIAHESGRPMNFALLRLRIHLAEVGRRVRINDLWIAASRGLPVFTQDNDFDVLNGVAGLTVVRI